MNAMNRPGDTDRANSDLPTGPMIISASDLYKVKLAHSESAAQDFNSNNNHWSENNIRLVPSDQSNNLSDWLQNNFDVHDPNNELNNLSFAFKDTKEAETYLWGQLNDYLNSHNLAEKIASFTGHSTYYHWLWEFDWSKGEDVVTGGKAKNYGPHWVGEGKDNPGPGYGDDYEHMITAEYQDEMTASELPMTKQDWADAVKAADPDHASNRQQPANILMMLLAAQPTRSQNWPANLLPLLLSGYYTVTDKPNETDNPPEKQTVTVTVEYRDSTTKELVQTGESRTGQPGQTITLTFTALSGLPHRCPGAKHQIHLWPIIWDRHRFSSKRWYETRHTI